MNLKKQNPVDAAKQDRVSRSESKSVSSNNWLDGDTTTACQQRRIEIALRGGAKTTSELHIDVGVHRVSSRFSELKLLRELNRPLQRSSRGWSQAHRHGKVHPVARAAQGRVTMRMREYVSQVHYLDGHADVDRFLAQLDRLRGFLYRIQGSLSIASDLGRPN